jgi:transposase
MERIPNAVYTKEFREEAVMMVTEGGLTVPEVARRLSIPKSTISYWVRAKRQGTLSSVGGQSRSLTDEEREIARLRREVAELKMERDILKKATAYFAKESLPGTRS